MRWLHALFLALCAGGIGLLVANSGPTELWQEATHLGWTVPAIILLFGVEHGIRAVAWWCCYRPDARPSLGRLFWARLASYAFNTATPSATLGGEIVRASLLADTVPPLETLTAISVDRLADTLADCLLGLCGLVVLLMHAPFPKPVRLALLAAATLLGCGVGAFFVLQRRGRLAAIVTERSWIARILGERRAAHLVHGGQALDVRLRAFHAERPRAVGRALVLHVFGTSVGALQVACFLGGLGVPASTATVLAIFVTGVALDLFSFFVPARLAAQEGARMVAMALVGLPSRLGLLFSLVLRLEQLSWTLVGFVAYLGLAPGASRARLRRASTTETVPSIDSVGAVH